MAWIKLNTVFFTNGSATVSVYDPVEIGRIQEGWALFYKGEIYEISSAVTNESVPHFIYLEKPWAGVTEGPIAIQVIPINASFESVLYRYEEAVAYLNAWRETFDLLAWRRGKDMLQVTADGSRINPISLRDFFGQIVAELGDEIGEAAQSEAIAGLQEEVKQPVGAIVPYRFTGFPEKYLELNGAIQQYNEYPELGALYGATPGGTFALDDWRGLPIWGATGADLGTVTGSDDRDLTHTHAMQHGHDLSADQATAPQAGATTQLLGLVKAPSNRNDTGAGLGITDIRPRRAMVRWLIRAQP